MRRKDREITDDIVIDAIIEKCHCCRLGFCDGQRPYIVPLSFGYTHENGKRFFYFHGAKEGRKIDLIKSTGIACFELDTNFLINAGNEACDYSCRFESVMGEGKVRILEDKDEKCFGLIQLMKHETGKIDWNFPRIMLSRTCVFVLEVDTITCKIHE